MHEKVRKMIKLRKKCSQEVPNKADTVSSGPPFESRKGKVGNPVVWPKFFVFSGAPFESWKGKFGNPVLCPKLLLVLIAFVEFEIFWKFEIFWEFEVFKEFEVFEEFGVGPSKKTTSMLFFSCALSFQFRFRFWFKVWFQSGIATNWEFAAFGSNCMEFAVKTFYFYSFF